MSRPKRRRDELPSPQAGCRPQRPHCRSRTPVLSIPGTRSFRAGKGSNHKTSLSFRARRLSGGPALSFPGSMTRPQRVGRLCHGPAPRSEGSRGPVTEEARKEHADVGNQEPLRPRNKSRPPRPRVPRRLLRALLGVGDHLKPAHTPISSFLRFPILSLNP